MRQIATLLLIVSLCALPSPASAGDGSIHGIASNYCCTKGFGDEVVLALAGGLGGRYTGEINAMVTVCADRCVEIPAVDYCQCYWGTRSERLVDLTPAAWAAVSDTPLSRGLIPVTITIGGAPFMLPNTAFGP